VLHLDPVQRSGHHENRYVGSGGVGANVQRASVTDCRAPLPTTVQPAGAVTAAVKGALRSGWSKQARTSCALSTLRYAPTYVWPSSGST